MTFSDSDYLQFSSKFSMLLVQAVRFSSVQNQAYTRTVNMVNSSATPYLLKSYHIMIISVVRKLLSVSF